MTTIDLHTHTRASDGSDTPAELVEAAARAGVKVLAVTDHDTVAAVAAAQAAGAEHGVRVLVGLEITGEVAGSAGLPWTASLRSPARSAGGRVVHLLAYGAGLLAPGAVDRVEAVRRERLERNHRIGERLEALTGVGYDQAAALAGRSALSRAHFARALIQAGVVADTAEAFDRYLSNGRPAYAPAPSLPVEEVVALVHGLGGLVVLAHPGRLGGAEADGVVAAAIEAGIDGLEVWHSQHDADARHHWQATADRHGLLVTGGSDYHGAHKPTVRIGSGTDDNVDVPDQVLADLEERLSAVAG
ncbi:MAG TPA: PHP domain-containing protein [Actinomycetota bacterium]